MEKLETQQQILKDHYVDVNELHAQEIKQLANMKNRQFMHKDRVMNLQAEFEHFRERKVIKNRFSFHQFKST